MSLRTYLQDHPAFMVLSWRMTERMLRWIAPLFVRLNPERASRFLHPLEMLIKRPLFDCRECGQCLLHYTGMTCPMTCPKNLRNGPCGGVRLDGTCEVFPDRACVWLKAVERIERTPWPGEIRRLNPPVDCRLQGTSAWVNYAVGRDRTVTGSDADVRRADEVLGGEA